VRRQVFMNAVRLTRDQLAVVFPVCSHGSRLLSGDGIRQLTPGITT
jgi:hypothetical protein